MNGESVCRTAMDTSGSMFDTFNEINLKNKLLNNRMDTI